MRGLEGRRHDHAGLRREQPAGRHRPRRALARRRRRPARPGTSSRARCPCTGMRRRRRIDVLPGRRRPPPIGSGRSTRTSATRTSTTRARPSCTSTRSSAGSTPPPQVVLDAEATPRVLPWFECPEAAASAGRLAGRSLDSLRAGVPGRVPGRHHLHPPQRHAPGPGRRRTSSGPGWHAAAVLQNRTQPNFRTHATTVHSRPRRQPPCRHASSTSRSSTPTTTCTRRPTRSPSTSTTAYKGVIKYIDIYGPHQDHREGHDQRVHPQPHVRRGGRAGRAGGVLQERQPRRQVAARDPGQGDPLARGVLRARAARSSSWTSSASTGR